MPQQQMIPSAEQFFALIYQTQVLAMQLYQIQVMTAQLRQMQREIFALHMENTILNQRFNFRGYQMVQRPPMPYGRLFMRHRQFRNSMIHN